MSGRKIVGHSGDGNNAAESEIIISAKRSPKNKFGCGCLQDELYLTKPSTSNLVCRLRDAPLCPLQRETPWKLRDHERVESKAVGLDKGGILESKWCAAT